MGEWYTTREDFQRAAGKFDEEKVDAVDRHIEAASRFVERTTRRWYIPRTETHTFRWPGSRGAGLTLWLDKDLISVTTLQTQAQDDCPTTISSCDFFVEPSNTGPPFSHIEIDLSSTSTFQSGDTPQRSISVAGCWGYSACTKCGGKLACALTGCATTAVVTDASKVDVGHTLLIDCERLFVSEKDFASLSGVTITGNCGSVGACMATNTVTVSACHGIQSGEVVRLDCEQMLVLRVRCNCLNVRRAYIGTVLASHCDCTAVHVNRTLTVERGVNGTCAATHCACAGVCVYEPPHDIQNWTLGEAIHMYHQEAAAWAREIGSGEGSREFRGAGLTTMRDTMTKHYKRARIGVI